MAALEFQKQPRIASTAKLDITLRQVRWTERWKWISIVPATRGVRWPAIVCIHGGGWAKGNRTNHRNVAQALAAQRICDRHDFLPAQWRSPPSPAAIQDCKAAVRFLRANAKRLWNRCRQNWSDWTLRRWPFDRVARPPPEEFKHSRVTVDTQTLVAPFRRAVSHGSPKRISSPRELEKSQPLRVEEKSGGSFLADL